MNTAALARVPPPLSALFRDEWRGRPYLLSPVLDMLMVGGAALPGGFFVLLFVIFINVHHFFIDNVIWRKENTDVGRYLFGWRKARTAT